jgi:ABC-type multidrug transport system ATPase subunit/pSer/pThr/pTyr-binding forkhead associated (FHA) protein
MPCQFTIVTGARAGSTFSFAQPNFRIGRDPRCEFAFDPNRDLTVSGHHATITFVDGAYHLQDFSSNGTFINGQQIQGRVVINHGDQIELGRGGPHVRFETASAQTKAGVAQQQPAPVPAPVQPVQSQPGFASAPHPGLPPTQGPAQAAAAPLPATGAQPGVPASAAPARRSGAPTAQAPIIGQTISEVSIAIEKPPGGQRLDFKKALVRIGRDPSADIAFDPNQELLVSFNHAKIVVVAGQATLYDLDSTNGTYINGEQIARRDLSGGEVVELGRGGPQIKVLLETKQVAAPSASHERSGATVFGAATPLKDLSLGEAELFAEFAIKPSMTIGRDSSCDIVLDSMYVSNRHAKIEQQNGQVKLLDTDSANGVFLGGEKVIDTILTVGAEFVVGPFVLKYSPNAVLVFDTRTRTWVDAFELTRTDQRSKRNFLDRISLKVQPSEFVCILGPSGCGKSTLLKSLNGYTRADAGTVLLNNVNFYNNYEQVKHQVGYVPQDDIIHPQLSIERTLQYAARLRLPPGTSKQKRNERIQDVLSMLELYDHRKKPVHKLSGGQRKRVSIAVELLTEPAIIYLDEPTSGLDPNLEEKMMVLLRDLTTRGKTVVTVTHTLDNIHLADKVTFLVEGKLAFFGTADEARDFFGVEKLPDVYKRFEERKGKVESLRDDFKDSEIFKRHIESQLSPDIGAGGVQKAAKKGKRIGPGAIRQFWVLTQRYTEIITRDVKNTLILLIQAPLVALFIVAAVRSDQAERGPTSTMFLIMSLSALWFGCSNAARELTKEAAIYARERMVNLRVVPYVLSKFFVLQFLALLQVTTMLTLVYFLRSGYTLSEPPGPCVQYGIQACGMLILDGVPGGFLMHLLNLYLTALCGIGLGLLVSAIAGNSDKAMSLVPLILIPQVLFSGSFGIPKTDEHVKRAVGYAMALNWSLDQSKRIAMCSPEDEKGKTGCTVCIHAYDPFKHRRKKAEDQPDDARCEALLPVVSSLVDYPETLQVVENGLYTAPSDHEDGPPRRAHKSFIPMAVQGGMVLLLLILVCIFVRLKDRQNR